MFLDKRNISSFKGMMGLCLVTRWHVHYRMLSIMQPHSQTRLISCFKFITKPLEW